jgi:hypothetical protein
MKRIIFFAVTSAMILWTSAFAQSDDGINIFGYFQGQFLYSEATGSAVKTLDNFGLQQMNMLFQKNLGPSFSAFINLQFEGNFSSDKNWGSLNVEEAWAKYQASEAFNVKAGLLVPTFNNFNEIKTKTPLLPYIMRPLVYESPLAVSIAASNFVPERAFVQVYGALPVGSLKFDYAAYIGNNHPDFVTNVVKGSYLTGQDTSMFKMVGGRIGIRSSDLKIGLSGTWDRTNPGSASALPYFFQGTGLNNVAAMLGPVVRMRYGVDLSVHFSGVTLEGEYIDVVHSLTDKQSATLALIPTITRGMLRGDLDKSFYYGTVQYDVNEQWYTYAAYSKLQDKFNMIYESGMASYNLGLGFRPLSSMVLKAQYAKYEIKGDLIQSTTDTFAAAISVYF